MRRVAGLIASGLGSFLLVSGLLLRFYVAGQVVRFPLNEYQITTLAGKDVTYFSPSLLKDVTGVTMRVTKTTEGDFAAGTSSRAVWTQFSYSYDVTNAVAYQSLTQRSAFDRRTGALIGCCGAAVGSYTGRPDRLAVRPPPRRADRLLWCGCRLVHRPAGRPGIRLAARYPADVVPGLRHDPAQAHARPVRRPGHDRRPARLPFCRACARRAVQHAEAAGFARRPARPAHGDAR